MEPKDVVIDTIFKLFIILMVFLAVTSILDIALQIAIIIKH